MPYLQEDKIIPIIKSNLYGKIIVGFIQRLFLLIVKFTITQMDNNAVTIFILLNAKQKLTFLVRLVQ